jgi:hypothetical protein
MFRLILPTAGLLAVVLTTAFSPRTVALPTADTDSVQYAEEKHLRNVRQLTFGGDNAEA